MKKSILKLAAFSLLAAAIAVMPVRSFGEEKPAAESEAASKPIPFNGKITSVDKDAKTITVGQRTFQITSDTKIMKDDKPATLDDAKVGDVVGGAYKKSADGKLIAVSVRLGPKPPTPENPKMPKTN